MSRSQIKGSPRGTTCLNGDEKKLVTGVVHIVYEVYAKFHGNRLNSISTDHVYKDSVISVQEFSEQKCP